MLRDIEAHYGHLKGDGEEETLLKKLEVDILKKLKGIEKTIAEKKYDPKVSYPSLYLLKDNKLIEQLTPHREALVTKVKNPKQTERADRHSLLYDFLAKERDIINAEKDIRLKGHRHLSICRSKRWNLLFAVN